MPRLEQLPSGNNRAEMPPQLSMSLEKGGTSVDRTVVGWGGRSLSDLRQQHRQLRLGAEFHPEADVAYAEMAQMRLLRAEEAIAVMRRAGQAGGSEYERQVARKREAEAELAVIPPEARMDERDVVLLGAYEKAWARLTAREQELGERKAGSDLGVQGMREDVKRLREDCEHRKCEKIIFTAAALKLPPAEQLLPDGKGVNDIVYGRNHTSGKFEPWRVLYATDITTGGSGHHAILRNEADGRMKLVDIGELDRNAYYMTQRAFETRPQWEDHGRALPASSGKKALMGQQDSRSSEQSPNAGTQLALRREVPVRRTFRSLLSAMWRALRGRK